MASKYSTHVGFFHSFRRYIILLILLCISVITVVNNTLANEATLSSNWSNPATWGGTVPVDGSSVVIPVGLNVVVDVPSINMDSITIPFGAKLTFIDRDTTVRTKYINVMGHLQAGTSSDPLTSLLTFTFYGDDRTVNDITQNGHPHGTKGLYATGSGIVDIHGDSTPLSWTRLGGHASAGTNQIVVADNTGWSAGDLIVIASTDFDVSQTEQAIITVINGNVITLDRALNHFHFGQTQNFNGRIIENRAEVGLLSRNIVIQGEMGNDTTFGAHTMFMGGTTVRISGTEFTNVGQEAILARYPFHTHLAQDMSESYFRGNSIHKSFNRAITIHGTDFLTVEDNVAFDIVGHGIFFEDAAEQFNVVEGNLVMLTRTPNQPLIPSDADTFGPASYWISNPNNIIRNNVAAGSEGTGFWYDLQQSPTGASANIVIEPRRLPLGEFSNNVAHSNHMIGMFIEPYFPTSNQIMTGLTAYKNRGHGAWVTSNGQLMDGGWIEIHDSAFLDNGTGVLVAGGGRIVNSIYVGVSENSASTELLWNSTDRPLYGHRFYDGPAGVESSTFYNYQPTSDYQAAAFGWRHNIAEGRFLGNHVENITFVNANQAYFVNNSNRGELDTDISYESMAFEDHDGSFGGNPNSVIATGFPLSWDADDIFVPEWNGYIVNNHVGLFRIACNGDTCPTTIIRDDGARAEIGADGRFNASMERYYTIYRNDTSCDFEVSLVHEYVNDWAIFATPYTCDLTNMQDANTTMVAGNSYDEVVQATDGSVYYHDTTENKIYFKLVQPRDNEFEVEKVNRYFDYVRVSGTGTNEIVTPPDVPSEPPETLTLASISETTTISDSVFMNIADANSNIALDMSTLAIASQPPWGDAMVLDQQNGILAYVPDDISTGLAIFGYDVCDSGGICGTGSITVDIQDNTPSEDPNPPIGDGAVSGDLMQWHRVAVTFDGPQMSENNPATFTDHRLMVTFTNGQSSYTVPGFFAADGNAANTGATDGNKWRAYFTPDATGTWTYTASFRTGNLIAISLDPNAGTPGAFDGATGIFDVVASTAPETDFRYHGMLRYVGQHHFQFAGSGEYYLKNGADSPENFLGYDEFDGTFDTGGVIDNFLHSYNPHTDDWRAGDPTWGTDNRGKGIIGALNYLADQGVNSYYFITYNIDGGDGADTWPWTDPNARETFDISKLDQWEIVFSHMTARGIQLHFLTQETENDGELGGNGDLNVIRQLYYREMIARFAHHPALQWNIGEENSNGPQQQKDFAAYVRSQDPYSHPITIHSNYNAPTNLYAQLYGDPSYEATSIQGDASNYNEWAILFRENSAGAGRPWAIYGDEQGPQVASNMGNIDELRRDALWGNLMGGGAGVEWYFGYQGDFGDIQSEDFRLAEPLWQDSDYAVDFFQTYLPFHIMTPDNTLVDNGLALANVGDTYAVYLPFGGSASLNIANNATYDVFWYNPRTGGNLQTGSITQITGPGSVSIGNPPSDPMQDWAVLVRNSNNTGENRAPTINALADQTIREDTSVSLPVTANDIDGDPISMILTAPDFVTFQDNGNGSGTLTIAPPVASTGTYDVTINVDDGNGGQVQESFTLTVSVDDPAPGGISISQFVLVNADTNQDISVLENMTVIDRAVYGDSLNVRADTMPGTVGSVVFDLNGTIVTENVAPYALAGDGSGNYNAWELSTGSYTLTATPYTEGNSSGLAGDALTINFTIVDDGGEPPTDNRAPVIAPVPVQTLTVNDPINVVITATDADGDTITLSANGVPAYLTFVDNGNGTGSITGIAGQIGNIVITIGASDGTDDSRTSITLVVNEDSSNETVEITGFTLIDATTGTDITSLQNGDVIDASGIESLEVRADVSSPGAQQVVFDLNAVSTTDNSNPFTIGVDAGQQDLLATPYQIGSLLAVNPANYGYDVARSNVSIPPNAIRLSPGDDVRSIVSANPDGTAFIFSAGVYRQQQIIPRNGQQFYGESGAILSGASLLTDFRQEGSLWVVDNQTQQGRTLGECLDSAPRCWHPEDLYIDGMPLRHVPSLNQVTSGSWFFDYDNDRIYFADNPAGRVVETSITEYAFSGTANNVLISNLTIEKYASPAQVAAISAVDTNGWIVQNNIITLNHGGGIQVGNNTHVVNNYVYYNGHIGVSGIGDNIVVEWNDIARNNYAGYEPGWEAGGTKFVLTNNLMVRHNYVYDNMGPGLWTDIDNINSTYDANLVINNKGIGIFHEISYDVTISNNVSMYNAKNDFGWLYGGQIVISSSSNAQVFNNRTVVSDIGGNGITIVQQNRGSGKFGIRRSWNNIIFDNVIIYLGNVGQTGAAADWEEQAFFEQGGNRFDGNIYYATDMTFNHWAWQGNIRWEDFQARGQDVNGVANFNGVDSGLIAGTPVQIQFEIIKNTTEPEAPSELSATAISSADIELSWLDNATDELYYEIERDSVIIAPVPMDSTSYYDSDLTAETNYCYRVRAVNEASNSTWSESVCATTLADSTVPDAPTGVTVQSISDTENTIEWSDQSDNEAMFEIERDGISINFVPADSTVYFDSSLNSETEYCYRVRAIKDSGQSAWSESVCATTNSSNGGENLPPTLQSPGDQVNKVGDSVALQLQYNDPEEGNLRFTANNLPDGLSIDVSTGLITGTPITITTATVTIIVTDPDGATGETTFNWTINGTGDIADAVTAFVLVNADTNQDIMTMSNGMQLNWNTLPTRNLNIRAQTIGSVGSVRFSLDGNNNFRTENQAPFALAGDDNGDYASWTPSAGSHTLSATPYTDGNASGTTGNSLSISFTIVSGGTGNPPPVPTATPVPSPQPPSDGSMAVTRFVLVNADTNQDIMVLTNGQSIALNSLPTRRLNIRVNVSGNVGSVMISFNSGTPFAENDAPFAVHRDTDGDYNIWQPQRGAYTVAATPYAQDYGEGTQGTGATLSITFTNN